MRTYALTTPIIFFLSFLTLSCENEPDVIDPVEEPAEETPREPPRIGFELIEILSQDSILVWINDEPLSQEAFDSIQTTAEWRKNEPRTGDPDGAVFLRSPNATADGEFTRRELFGYQWLFNAQIIEQNVPLPSNEASLLNGRYIAKYHRVQFNAGKTLFVLISPDGEEYVRISRDANRTTDVPVIPDTWRLEERMINENLSIDLPNPTLNIRAENNQDSFQGPVTF